MRYAKIKTDALELSKIDIKRLEKLIKDLKAEKSAGLCIPIRALCFKGKGKDGDWCNEWQLSDDWEGKRYKEWLDDYSNRNNKDFDGFEKYTLTWAQIREIIEEEKHSLLVTINSLKDYIKLSENVKIHKQVMEENGKLRMDKIKLEGEIIELKEGEK